MTDKTKPRKAAGPRRDHLPEDVQLLLDELEQEAVPENLLKLAQQLQEALDEKLKRSRH
jgi:hypothetical protein